MEGHTLTNPRTLALSAILMVSLPTGFTRNAAAGAMVTDRPTRTDSPYSVPAEHFQLEMDALTFGHYADDSIEIDDWSIAPFNLKYGFTDRVDVQLLFTPYQYNKVLEGGDEAVDDGIGPAGLRFKINLAGNEGTGTAVALLPYIIAPTRGIEKLDYTVYGLAVPVSFPLDAGRAIGAEAGVEQLGDIRTFGRASVVFTSPVAGGWSGFVELYGIMDGFDDEDGQIVTLDVGGVFAPRDDFALDLGVYYGITSDAENWRVFAGLSAYK